MKVLFIGGTGIISEAVTKQAIMEGIDLYLFNRGQQPEFIPEGAKLIKGDIRDKESAAEVLKNHTFDVVVDWVAYIPEHIKTDIELFRSRTLQYIFISSASAYQKPSSHYLITESTPLVNPYWEYSRNKIACEELLMNEYRNTGFPVTIVRPSTTYGMTLIPSSINSAIHPWSLVDRMRKGKKIIVHGDGTSLWTITHNSDFAKGFIGLLNNSQAIGHAFHITSDEVLSWDQIYRTIGNAAGVEPQLIHIPSDFIALFDPDATGYLLGDKVVSIIFDNSKIKRFVPGFNATVSLSRGVKQTIQWFENHPERCTVDDRWNIIMDKIINAYEQVFNKDNNNCAVRR